MIDKTNGNRLWQDAIELEIKNSHIAFQLFEGDVKNLVGYQQVRCHLIFDIKLSENFRRKARLVAGGHTTSTPSSVTYSSVVARDSVRIVLLLAALNDLDLQSADIQNAYLTAPNREKIWTRAGPEFGDDEGCIFLVVRALYGLKSAGASFRAHLAKHLHELGFTPSEADPDVWMRPATKSDGFEYYEYILTYVDDLLCISHDAVNVLKSLQNDNLKFKNNEIKSPTSYLGATLEKKSIKNEYRLNDRECWTMNSSKYIESAIENIEEYLSKKSMELPKRIITPFSNNYDPHLDESRELDHEEITFFQEQIGVLRWAIEITRVDILFEVTSLSSYQASPRQGRLEQIYHIFAFLKNAGKLMIYFDPNIPNF